jgi:hypothetical protein
MNMKALVGQLMRLGGLIVEMLGVYAVMKGVEGPFAAKVQLPGFEPVPIGWIGVGFGFVLWLVGTVLVYSSRPSRKKYRPEIEKPV